MKLTHLHREVRETTDQFPPSPSSSGDRFLSQPVLLCLRPQTSGSPQDDLRLLDREFFYAVASNNPYFDKMEGNPVCIQVPWDKNPEALAKWAEGRTGFPWIDAIMVQLKKEGWISTSARRAVICFLTRGDLWISWEEGAKVSESVTCLLRLISPVGASSSSSCSSPPPSPGGSGLRGAAHRCRLVRERWQLDVGILQCILQAVFPLLVSSGVWAAFGSQRRLCTVSLHLHVITPTSSIIHRFTSCLLPGSSLVRGLVSL